MATLPGSDVTEADLISPPLHTPPLRLWSRHLLSLSSTGLTPPCCLFCSGPQTHAIFVINFSFIVGRTKTSSSLFAPLELVRNVLNGACLRVQAHHILPRGVLTSWAATDCDSLSAFALIFIQASSFFPRNLSIKTFRDLDSPMNESLVCD